MVATILTGAAESNRGILLHVPEVTWGTTPGSGNVQAMRFTSSNLTGKKATKRSEEIRADRMTANIIEVAASTDGDVNWEAAAGSQDAFYEDFMLANWSRAMNFLLVKGSSVTITGVSQITITGKDWTDWLSVNQYVKLEGFLLASNNGYFKVTAKAFTSGNTVITVTETSLTAEAGTAYTKLMDANDVILKSTLTAIVATNKLNGGGANAFAGQTLKVGQTIYVEGLGKETGIIALEADLPVNNESFSISDGVTTKVFEFASSSALITPGHVFVLIDPNPSVQADKIVTAVMDQFRQQNLRVSAVKVAGTKEAGSIAFSSQADNGDTVTIDDGRSGPVVFSFAASGNGATGAAVNVATGGSAAASATNLFNAINANLLLSVTATNGVAGTTAVVNDLYTGGAITKSDGDNDYAVTDFTSGVKPSLTLTNHRLTGGAIVSALASVTETNFSGGSAAKGGYLTISSLPDDDSIVVAETITNDANGGALTIIIKGSHLRNPGVPADIIKKSRSIETGFTDVTKYLGSNGLRLGSWKQTLSPGDIVKGSFSFMGRETLPLEATVLGDTGSYTVFETTSTEPLNATSNVSSLLRDGVALTTAVLKLDVMCDANLREQKAVGAKFPAGIGYGSLMIKGSMSCYFQNFDQYTIFFEHRTASLGWQLEDADHNNYKYTVPSVKFLSDPISPDGLDKDVTEEIQWQAQRDASLGTMMMIDRFSSVWPASVA